MIHKRGGRTVYLQSFCGDGRTKRVAVEEIESSEEKNGVERIIY